MQEHAGLGIDRDPVVALVGDVEPAVHREGKTLRIVELAVAAAAAAEHALGVALGVDHREQIVAGIPHREAAIAHPGHAAHLLRLERTFLAHQLGGRGVVAGDAPERPAIAVHGEHGAIGRKREAGELGKVQAAGGGLPGAHELHFERLRRRDDADERKHAAEREPRIPGKQWRPPPSLERRTSGENSSTHPPLASRRSGANAVCYCTFFRGRAWL